MKSTIPNRSRLISVVNKTSLMFFLVFLLQVGTLFSQTLVYDNFEGNKVIRYTERTGVFDSVVKNPKIDGVNGSAKCGFYIRNKGKKFDNIKMELPSTL